MDKLPKNTPVAIMFSGGRDSTLAAAFYAEQSHALHLLTFDQSCRIPDDVVRARVSELRRRWPDTHTVWAPLSVSKALRDIALIDLIDDAKRYHKNLICLGSALAMIARSIEYCRSRRISILAAGYSGYQTHFPEQSDTAVQFFSTFAREYGIELRCPSRTRQAEEESKELLDALGLSTKALEPTSMWDWTYAENVDPDLIRQYLTDKRPIAQHYIQILEAFRCAPDLLGIVPTYESLAE